MAVLSSTLMATSGEIATQNKTQYTLKYHVKSDRDMTAEEVYVGALSSTPDPLPPLYSLLATNTSLYCQQISVNQFSDVECAHWYFEPRFSALPPGETEEDNNPDPRQRPPKIRLDFDTTSREVTKDINGDDIVNGLNQRFPDPVVLDKHLPMLIIEKKLEDLAAVIDLQDKFEDTVNSGLFLNKFEAEQVKFDGVVSASEQSENGFTYIQTQVRLAINKDGWAVKKANEGVMFEDDDGNLVAATDDAGNHVSITTFMDVDNKAVTSATEADIKSFDVLTPIDYDELLQ